jgi:ribonuclease HI
VFTWRFFVQDNKVAIYTDGACSGNPGKGGWGALLIFGEHQKEISGGEAFTTNNRMELRAVIEALKILKKSCQVIVYTDSQYVKKGITEWLFNWKKNNWKNSQKEEVKNKDLWLELDKIASGHDIDWRWVKGHADDIYNNKVDSLARGEIKKSRINGTFTHL